MCLLIGAVVEAAKQLALPVLHLLIGDDLDAEVEQQELYQEETRPEG